MARVAGRTDEGTATEDQPAADAGRHHHSHHRIAPPTGSDPGLGHRDADGIAGEPHVVARQERAGPGLEGEVAPGGDVDGCDRAHGEVDRSGRPDAQSGAP